MPKKTIYHILKEGGRKNPLIETGSKEKVTKFLKKIRKKKKYKNGVFYVVKCEEGDKLPDTANEFPVIIKKKGKDISAHTDAPMLTTHLTPPTIIELRRLAIREDRLTNKQKYGISNEEYRREKYNIQNRVDKEDLPLNIKLCKQDYLTVKYDISLLEKAQEDLSEIIKSPQIHADTKLFEEIEKAISIREKTLKKKREKLFELKSELEKLLLEMRG